MDFNDRVRMLSINLSKIEIIVHYTINILLKYRFTDGECGTLPTKKVTKCHVLRRGKVAQAAASLLKLNISPQLGLWRSGSAEDS